MIRDHFTRRHDRRAGELCEAEFEQCHHECEPGHRVSELRGFWERLVRLIKGGRHE